MEKDLKLCSGPFQIYFMDIKRVFGSILTGLGIIGLIYAAVLFVNTSPAGAKEIKILFTYSLLGLIFFASGISLIKMTAD